MASRPLQGSAAGLASLAPTSDSTEALQENLVPLNHAPPRLAPVFWAGMRGGDAPERLAASVCLW